MRHICKCKLVKSKHLDVFDKWYENNIAWLEMARRANEQFPETKWNDNDFRRHYQEHILPDQEEIKEFSKRQISDYIRMGLERCEKKIKMLIDSDTATDVRNLQAYIDTQRRLAELFLQYEKELKKEERVTFENVAETLAKSLEEADVPANIVRKAIKALERDFGG